MAAINGTSLLLYSEGVAIAMQKGVSITVEQDLPDATSKDSGAWANHINGLLNAKIDFNALFGTGLIAAGILSAKDLMDYIINRETLLVSILGLGYPIIGQADLSSLSFDAPQENSMTLSGSLKINGRLYVLSAAMPNLITDPDGGGSGDYEEKTIVGTAVSHAKNNSGVAFMYSNTFSVTSGDVFKIIMFFTNVSGQLPTCGLNDTSTTWKSNIHQITEGLNVATLTATASGTWDFIFYNTDAAEWGTSPIYLIKI